MNIINIIKRAMFATVIPAVVFLASCDDENYLKFDISNSGVYFTKDTLNYSFSVTPIDVKTYTYHIPVKVMGGISDIKRPIGFYVDPDSTIAEEGVHFTIGEACIMPDSIMGSIPVTIYRDKLEGTYATGYTRYKLCVRLVQNDYFTPTLDSLHQVRILRFDNSVDQPEWYNAHGEKVWQKKYLGEWHPLKFIKMVEFFHAVKDIQPETYKAMVKLYGENLEHIEFGDPYQYRTVFIKYIYTPMYNYFNDPAERDYILSNFPDFPFDFPDPKNI
jgi:hypothetical protein